MGVVKIHLIFILSIFVWSSGLHPKIDRPTPTDQKKGYTSLENVLRSSRHLRVRWEYLNLMFDIKTRSDRFRFLIDSDFYILNGNQFTLNKPILYEAAKVWLPREVVRKLRVDLKPAPKPRKEKRQKKTVISKTKTNASSSNAPVFKKRLDFIIIDPGHGGKDPGAKAWGRLLEKDVALKISKRLYTILKKKFPRTSIVMTRWKDKFVSLERRAVIANRYLKKNKFGLFLSVHCNATFSPRSRGLEIYYLNRSRENDKERLMTLRDQLSFVKHKNSKKLLSHLVDSQVQRESKILADEINHKILVNLNQWTRSRGIRKADFSVLRGVSMPALLVEVGYLTNQNEAYLMQKRVYQLKLGQSIAEGIKNFLKKFPDI